MSAHRRWVITRKADGAFWAGTLFGFVGDANEGLVFDSLRGAYAELCEVNNSAKGEHAEDCFVEPADWYLEARMFA